MAPIARCLTAARTTLLITQVLLERRKLVASSLALTALIGASAAVATPQVGEQDNGWSIIEEQALHTYEDCWAALGSQCGRNIVDDGLASGNPPSDAKVAEWTATMQRWLNPPEPPVASTSSDVVAPATPATTSVAPATASTGGCPASMAPESGSAGYSAYNPSSGATGCYQIIPSTAAAHGCDLSTPGGQDECAARICETQGSSAWAASGASPC